MIKNFKTIKRATGLVLAVMALSFGGSAHAGQYDKEVSHLTLLPGWERSDGYYLAAVQIDLEPGWKTYWRSPGVNGIPPEFDWSGSDNLAQVGYLWPSPSIMDEEGVRTIGYADRLILPILLRPRDPGQPIHMDLKMTYGVCEDICERAQSEAELSVKPAEVHNQDLINAALGMRSKPANAMGLVSSTCSLVPDGDDFVLTASFEFGQSVEQHRVVVVEAGSDLIWVSEADHKINQNNVWVQADLQYYGDGAMTLDRSALRFTMLNDGTSIEIAGCTGN